MIAVIFEVYPTKEGKAEYLELAAGLKQFLKEQQGLISIERFQSLNDKGKVLSLSFWESKEAVEQWRNLIEHRSAQKQGKDQLFQSYHIRVGEILRDYSNNCREQAPPDSNRHLS